MVVPSTAQKGIHKNVIDASWSDHRETPVTFILKCTFNYVSNAHLLESLSHCHQHQGSHSVCSESNKQLCSLFEFFLFYAAYATALQ